MTDLLTAVPNRDTLFDGLDLAVVDAEVSLEMTPRASGDMRVASRTAKGACHLLFPADRVGAAFVALRRRLEIRQAATGTADGDTFLDLVVHGAWQRKPVRVDGRMVWTWELVVAQYGFVDGDGAMQRGGRTPAISLA